VEEGDASVLISGEILNEAVKCRLHFTCKDITASSSGKFLLKRACFYPFQKIRFQLT
jgi:hypothetical protein